MGNYLGSYTILELFEQLEAYAKDRSEAHYLDGKLSTRRSGAMAMLVIGTKHIR
jgi:hypothetical protein